MDATDHGGGSGSGGSGGVRGDRGDDGVDEQVAPRRAIHRRRWRTTVAIGVLVIVLIGGLFAWRWRADRAYIGTEVPAELSWGDCLNSIGWVDPDTGIAWSAGHDIVTTGAYESEPRELHPGPRLGEPGVPARWVERRSAGTVRFDSDEQATFTSRAGGTLLLTRPFGEQTVTADCVGGFGAVDGVVGPPPEHYGVALQGVLATAPTGPDDGPLLAPGTVRVRVDGEVVTETSTTNGTYVVFSPVLGTMTVEGDLGEGTCAQQTLTVVSGVPDLVDLVCG